MIVWDQKWRPRGISRASALHGPIALHVLRRFLPTHSPLSSVLQHLLAGYSVAPLSHLVANIDNCTTMYHHLSITVRVGVSMPVYLTRGVTASGFPCLMPLCWLCQDPVCEYTRHDADVRQPNVNQIHSLPGTSEPLTYTPAARPRSEVPQF